MKIECFISYPIFSNPSFMKVFILKRSTSLNLSHCMFWLLLIRMPQFNCMGSYIYKVQWFYPICKQNLCMCTFLCALEQ